MVSGVRLAGVLLLILESKNRCIAVVTAFELMAKLSLSMSGAIEAPGGTLGKNLRRQSGQVSFWSSSNHLWAHTRQ